MRILIVQLKRLGDLVLTTPMIAALREHVPHAHITLALDASARSLAELIDHDDAIFHRGDGLQFWTRLIAGRFDTVIDVTGNDRSALVTALTRARRRITWQRFSTRPLRPVIYTDFVDSSVRNRHTSDHHTDLLSALGISVEGVPSKVSIPEIDDRQAAGLLAQNGIPGPFAIVHPGTARPEKYWLPERWTEVIGWIRSAANLPVVITGSGDPAEQDHLRRISADAVNLAGQLSLPVSAALIARAKFVCAVDSLPVHLADALGTPVVALFGPTNPFHWRPRRSTSHIVTPCGQAEITPDHPKAPMSEITVSAVTDALAALI